MKKIVLRVLIFLIGVAIGWRIARADDTTYRVKAVVVDESHKLLEAKFVVLPDDLRLVCHGEVKKIASGDYLKVEYTKDGFWIGNLACTEVRWAR